MANQISHLTTNKPIRIRVKKVKLELVASASTVWMELLKVFQIYGGHLVKSRTNVVSIFKETKLFHNIIENY